MKWNVVMAYPDATIAGATIHLFNPPYKNEDIE